MEQTMVRLHDMRLHTRVLGPETRTAIWFQGCKRRCPGCMSPESRPLDGGKLLRVSDIVDAVLSTHDIEGITISGGEPFLQVHALHAFLTEIRLKSNIGVIVYTGFTMRELSEQNDEKINDIISGLADLIIDGEYIDALNDGKSLRGSSNQTLNFITDRYKPYLSLYGNEERNAEVIVSGTEALFIGIPDKETLDRWRSTTEGQRDQHVLQADLNASAGG